MMEWLVFLIMIGVFLLLTFKKVPIGLALAASAIVAMPVSGMGFSLAKIFEGAFGYFDAIMVIASAMIFMNSINESGMLENLANAIVRRFYNRPLFLMVLMTLFIMSAGMITGSSIAAVLTTGAIASPVLLKMGLSKNRAMGIVAMSSVFGMIAPPVNIPVMIIGQGVDMPYMGFTTPLLWITIPLALFTTLFLCRKELKPIQKKDVVFVKASFWVYTPLVVLILLLVLESARVIPSLGMPLIFMISSLFSLVGAKKYNYFKMSVKAISSGLSIMSILIGVGMYIQVMTMTGVRGFIVSSLINLPNYMLYFTVGLGVPLFGAVSCYGSASVLGVPFLLAFIGGNDIIIAACISMLAALGDMMPPNSLAANFSAGLIGEKKYFGIVKQSIVPILVTIVYSVSIIIFSRSLKGVMNNILIFSVTAGITLLIIYLLDVLRYRRGDKNA